MAASNGSGLFPVEFLNELRARTPLVSLIGRRVKLTRAGKNHKGCCPFHAEETPSLTVYPDHFKCYECGKHGDAIDFVRETEGGDFQTVVKRMAAEAGLPLPANGFHDPVNGKPAASKPAKGEDWQPMVPPPHAAPEPAADVLK